MGTREKVAQIFKSVLKKAKDESESETVWNLGQRYTLSNRTVLVEHVIAEILSSADYFIIKAIAKK